MSDIKLAIDRLLSKSSKMIKNEVNFKELIYVKNMADELENETTSSEINGSSEKSIVEILEKVASGEELEARERKKLPFVMASEKCSEDYFFKCVNQIDIKNERTIKRCILMFFMNYSNMLEWKRKLFADMIIMGLDNSFHPINRFVKMMKYYGRIIFVENCVNNISRVIYKKGLGGTIEAMNLPDVIRYSDLVLESTRACFVDGIPINNKIDILMEIEKHKSEFYKIFPKIADALIKAVDKDDSLQKNEYKETCMDVLYEELGDPRISGQLFVRWNEVSEEARSIFLSWLASKDLDVFIEIIAKTAVDSMWESRKKFWLAYLPYITRTWVMFGRSAMEYVNQIKDNKMSYGKLKGASSNHSVFACQIGKYIFIEWSHNGKLRVWDKEYAPDIIGCREISKSEIVMADNFPLGEWIHSGNSNNKWQQDVEAWIEKNCGFSRYNSEEDVSHLYRWRVPN